jgi:hypothetical protein
VDRVTTVDDAGWVGTHHSLKERDVSGTTLEDGLAWCLVWLMAPEPGLEPRVNGRLGPP